MKMKKMKRRSGRTPAGGAMVLGDAEARLRREIGAFAAGYPEAWERRCEPGERPLDRLLRALMARIRGGTAMARTARRLGADLRRAHGYVDPEGGDEAAADLRRGLAYLALEVLHGADCAEFVAGDRLTPGQVAFYVADDWWPGRDDRPVEEWADIRRVREWLMLDALEVPRGERGDVLGFSARFVRRHPGLVREAAWGLGCVGAVEGFTEEVRAATGGDEVWRGVHFLAEAVLASLPDEPQVH